MEIGPGRLILIALTIVAAVMVGVVAGRTTGEAAETVAANTALYEHIDSYAACEAVGGDSRTAAAGPYAEAADSARSTRPSGQDATSATFAHCWPPP